MKKKELAQRVAQLEMRVEQLELAEGYGTEWTSVPSVSPVPKVDLPDKTTMKEFFVEGIEQDVWRTQGGYL